LGLPFYLYFRAAHKAVHADSEAHHDS